MRDLIEFLQQADSSFKVLLAFLVVGVAAGLLYPLGVYTVVGRLVAAGMRGVVHLGFEVWRSLFAWLPWLAVPVAQVALHLALRYVGFPAVPALLLGLVMLVYGVSACLAFVAVDQERSEIGRGYMVLDNPTKGQQVALKLKNYGQQVGLPLLVVAFIVCLDGFTLLNVGLYRTVGRSWYLIGTYKHHEEITAALAFEAETSEMQYHDFLVYTLLNLASAVDFIDVLNSSQWARIAYVHPAKLPVKLLTTGFRMFVTLLLLRQLFAWYRNQRRIRELVEDLWSPSEQLRDRARSQLGELGPAAAHSLLRAIEQVEFLNPEQRAFLASVITKAAPSVVVLYLKRLKHPQEHVRELAVASLGQLGAVEAIPALCLLGHDPSPRVRLALADALAKLFDEGEAGVRKQLALLPRERRRVGRAVPFLRRDERYSRVEKEPVEAALDVLEGLLDDADGAVRLAAVRGLGKMGPLAGGSLARLMGLVADGDDELRLTIAGAVGQIREPVARVLVTLRPLVRDDSPQVRQAALEVVLALEEDAYPLLPDLLPLLDDPEAAHRQLALDALNRIGRIGPGPLAELIRELGDKNPQERGRAAETLGYLGEVAAAAVPALTQALADDSPDVRGMAAWALGRMSAAALPAAPALAKAAADGEAAVCVRALEALARIGGDEATAGVTAGLGHASADVRLAAVDALVQLDLASADALAALASDADAAVRARVIAGLGDLGDGGPAVTQLLVASLGDELPQVRAAAVASLRKMGFHEEETVIFLVADPSPEVQTEVAHWLGTRQPPSAAVIDALERLLRAESEAVQIAATRALGELGEESAPAVEGLRHALERGSAAVRGWSLRALAQVQPDRVVEDFVRALHDISPDVRRLASAGLVRAADQLTEVHLPPVVESLHDADDRLRANLAMVLARRGVVPAGATPMLLDGSRDEKDGLRLTSVRALGLTAALAEEVPRLVADPNVRVALTAVVYQLSQAADEEALGRLRAAMAGDRRDRWFALQCLEALGPAARAVAGEADAMFAAEAVPTLRDRLRRVLEKLDEEPVAATE